MSAKYVSTFLIQFVVLFAAIGRQAYSGLTESDLACKISDSFILSIINHINVYGEFMSIWV